ncbi:hypothetical protein B296_00006801 [Ensete ventricosum]|uniref:Uncharacterized protein n=1 Tax=Ensete ventricosum TaxID=4639 RepID=A0A426YRT5_ENSVE|nr:hypothetical protein B296_00006801 [Ensete ventricosum]
MMLSPLEREMKMGSFSAAPGSSRSSPEQRTGRGCRDNKRGEGQHLLQEEHSTATVRAEEMDRRVPGSSRRREGENRRLSSTIAPGRYHCRNATLMGREGVGDDGGAMRALQFLQKFYKTQPLLKCYRDLWLMERHEIWKVTMAATSFGVGNSHNMVHRERFTPVVLQVADRGGW